MVTILVGENNWWCKFSVVKKFGSEKSLVVNNFGSEKHGNENVR